MTSDFAALDAGEYTDYPDEGYPVAFGAKSVGKRIVSFGGSSTGGAFQNDNLDEFYPAELQRRLRGTGIEVVNQGVGAWTTFHISHYIERQLPQLEPDILTLYVGHNDQLTPASVPYADLYERWRDGGLMTRQTSSLLSSVRLYQGFRFALTSLVARGDGVAVPLAHARDNLSRILTAARKLNAKVLLASEGQSPDPGALSDYYALLEQIAEAEPDVHYVDTAGLLDRQGPAMFLDDCHLTQAGHQVVAEAMEGALREAGWLTAPAPTTQSGG